MIILKKTLNMGIFLLDVVGFLDTLQNNIVKISSFISIKENALSQYWGCSNLREAAMTPFQRIANNAFEDFHKNIEIAIAKLEDAIFKVMQDLGNELKLEKDKIDPKDFTSFQNKIDMINNSITGVQLSFKESYLGFSRIKKALNLFVNDLNRTLGDYPGSPYDGKNGPIKKLIIK